MGASPSAPDEPQEKPLTDIETFDDTGTITEYLIVTPAGACLVDVHEMITKFLDEDAHRRSIYLVLCGHVPAEVEIVDVNCGEDDNGPFGGFEFEIALAAADKALVEYVSYTDESRKNLETHTVHVQGF